jgi:hypothetical protein
MELAQTSASGGRLTAIVCGTLLLCFAVISFSAVLTKNATIDEPSHSLSGWLSLRRGDFRFETVNPSLWKMWAALSDIGVNLKMVPEPAIWRDLTWNPPPVESGWASRMLFDTPGVDGGAFITRARVMMLILAILLGVLIARWSYRLGGPISAISATAIFCFDPNFIAHAPMVKSDIAFALDLLGLSYVVWLLGQRATWWRIILIGFICGVSGGTKYSGFITGPILALMLITRAIMPTAWNVLGRDLDRRFSRLLAAGAVIVFAALCCYVITWASYDFRFGPSPSPTVRMDMQVLYQRDCLVETSLKFPHATPAQIAAQAPSLTARFVQWADRVHFLPEPMLAGLLYQHSCVQLWPAFLNGEKYGDGRWYYFPLATLYKSPVSELTLYGGAALVLLASLRRLVRNHLWALVCFVIPCAAFVFAALGTHLNIGFRNVLPMFPFVQIASGCAIAISWRRRPRFTVCVAAILLTGLATETLSAWPDYIDFFNFPTGGETGGKARLADSNLDWGQDIIGLARWQRQHPGVKLYARLNYSVDPKFYGLDYHPIEIVDQGAGRFKIESDQPLTPGVIAVSVTLLQGLYIRPWEQAFFEQLRATQPIAVIGGTIYIYKFNP